MRWQKRLRVDKDPNHSIEKYLKVKSKLDAESM